MTLEKDFNRKEVIPGSFERLREQRLAMANATKSSLLEVMGEIREGLNNLVVGEDFPDGSIGDIREQAQRILADKENILTKKDVGIEAGAYMRWLVASSQLRPIPSEPNEKAEDGFGLSASALLIHDEIDESAALKGIDQDAPISIARGEHLLNERVRFQNALFRTAGADGTYGIAEHVTNNVYENFKDANGATVTFSSGKSDIILRRANDRALLYLNDLLPVGTVFCPSALAPVVKDSSGGAPRATTSDINKYQGLQAFRDDPTKKGKFEFQYEPNEKRTGAGRVVYGDIASSGGMLSLLHEIAHSWQHEHGHNSRGLSTLRRLMENILTVMDSFIESSDTYKHSIESAKNDKEIKEAVRLYIKKSTSIERFCEQKLGKDLMRLLPSKDAAIQDVAVVREHGEGMKFYIDRKVLNELLLPAIQEERDAWAIAIRTLRFLRAEGFDLEPSLRESAGIQNYVHANLATYQKMLDDVVIQGADHSFTRKGATP